ncbi:PREDICTED: allograft inflammatory factor 1-like [Amphimedon queenslandica]|uniref:EF-hand domain-containing protein n=2 Tax=Amphimedon queenslandica TaxID=400682 RepID=A0A1X7ULC0_AMPQE|nr:PREDICTED: allograft inflammatory factor 1-like [Amphimedon queenslandica]|eukprot:XP_003387413.1 PREDICTED: allograft inflammatory factor 1-like [Amphimedon queenslandica]
MANHQGGKAFGALKRQQEEDLDAVNQSFITSRNYDDDEDTESPLAERLDKYKKQFMEFDEDHSGDIDIMELKRMMEKLGQAKTHLELKKMIQEVDTTKKGTINYPDFLTMMLGKKNSILKLILKFEEMKKEKERPKGVAPKKSLADLP